MSVSVLTLDGKSYPGLFVDSLKRSFRIVDGPNTGRLMNFDMVRDVGGTFYNYRMDIGSGMSNQAEYDAFYEAISAPVDYHILQVPYGQSVLEFKAYITSGEDDLLEMLEDRNVWANLSINFIAMSPQRRPA